MTSTTTLLVLSRRPKPQEHIYICCGPNAITPLLAASSRNIRLDIMICVDTHRAFDSSTSFIARVLEPTRNWLQYTVMHVMSDRNSFLEQNYWLFCTRLRMLGKQRLKNGSVQHARITRQIVTNSAHRLGVRRGSDILDERWEPPHYSMYIPSKSWNFFYLRQFWNYYYNYGLIFVLRI